MTSSLIHVNANLVAVGMSITDLDVTPAFSPVLKSLHWIKVKERIEYKFLSLTYKVLTTSQPMHLFKLVSVQSPRSTRSSSVVTISRPPTSSSLKITNRSFQHAAPRLWNKLPHSFRNLIYILVFHLLTTLHTLDPHCHHHCFHHQSLRLFFTPDLKHTSS